jgi:hypothetical protein
MKFLLFLFVLFVVLAVIGALVRTVHRLSRTNQALLDQNLRTISEVEVLQHQRRKVMEIIKQSAGGVDKRISEHHEIVDAITERQPGLFEEEPGLKHWLSANSQFFHALKSAAERDHDSSKLIFAQMRPKS